MNELMKQTLIISILFTVLISTGMAHDSAIFPKGELAPNRHHTGDVWLNELSEADSDFDYNITLATFAVGAKLDWHAHPAGQQLLVLDGTGFYQERGEPVRIVKKGDVIKCEPGVEHWHAATPETGVTYLAITGDEPTEWLEPVPEEEFNSIEIPSATTRFELSERLQGIIPIAALAARGDLDQLRHALHDGLEAGLTINEIKEVLVHVNAYAGFPRSIRALQTFMEVLDEREARGIIDELGPEASPIDDDRDKYERGVNTLYELTGADWSHPESGYGAFAPVIDRFLKEHLFADLFERDVLTYAERQLTTVSVLSSLDGLEPMLGSHLNICLNVGLKPGQLQHFVSIIESTLGEERAAAAQAVLDEVLENRD